ncbi:hypothetical protein D0Z08_05855 [Nocardioides immobilis]|uniref:Uncharacterized protein n=1 Tax=Nocardioides immobilis TaxID=2049295 RepID=A0A417Y5J7_9ACTN|nr:hypothetical protein [Nocardioides immobilis]RHW27821.1 hypothetical protein D0Z08_05855 [Nocardioides immobilis]
MTDNLTLADLQSLACEDCPADVSIQLGEGFAGSVLTVVVVHAVTCPWAARCVPHGGVTLMRGSQLLRHVVASEPPC